jgi:hypothetical protein
MATVCSKIINHEIGTVPTAKAPSIINGNTSHSNPIKYLAGNLRN